MARRSRWKSSSRRWSGSPSFPGRSVESIENLVEQTGFGVGNLSAEVMLSYKVGSASVTKEQLEKLECYPMEGE